ncbi:MAG: class I SAM-dependent methyltransferase [Burkholderiales bacterium]
MDRNSDLLTAGAAAACSVPCNLCGSTHVRQVADRDRHGDPLRTVMCVECGLVWTDPRPDEAANRKFYAHDYRVRYKAAASPKLKHALRETRRAIARFRRVEPFLRAGARILDVGAGAGFFPFVLQSRGFDARGIEPNQGFCAWGCEVLGVQVTSGFLQDFDFVDEPFDLITLNHVLEHLPDPGAALGILRGWLKPEGLLVVEVPDVESDWHAPDKRFHIGHLYNFNRENLVRMALTVGLAAQDILIQPDTRHINVVFKRVAPEQPGIDRRLPANALHVEATLRRHTRLRHYASPVPHLRTLRKLAGYVGERFAVAGIPSARAVVEREVRKAFA